MTETGSGAPLIEPVAVLGSGPDGSVAGILRRCGLNVLDAEPGPKQLSDSLAARYGFGLASVRAGRLGNLRRIRQLVEEALTGRRMAHGLWLQSDGTVIDGARAECDPVGMPDVAAATIYREAHLEALRRLLSATRTLVLPLWTVAGVSDPSDGTVFAAAPSTVQVPKSLKLKAHRSDARGLDEDFAALHAVLKAVRPDLLIRVVITADPSDPDSSQTEALLRAVAAGWPKRFADVAVDPILDHLLGHLSEEETVGKLGGIVARLFRGAQLVDLLETGGTSAPALVVVDPAARRERRRKRREKRAGTDTAAVMCEDELLEAFS